MNRKLLLISESGSDLASVVDEHLPECEVHRTDSGQAAMRHARDDGPFAVMLLDRRPSDISADEFLARAADTWPETVRLWLSNEGLVEGADEDGQHRVLSEDLDGEKLCREIHGALERFHALESDRLVIERLRFSRESLIGMTETLEGRLDRQLARLSELYTLASELHGVNDLGELAKLVVHAASQGVGGAAAVEIWDPAGAPIRAGAGGDLSSSVHVEALETSDGRVGTLTVHRAASFGIDDERYVDSVATTASIAVGNLLRRLERDDAQLATVLALARLAEHRDNETGKHLERVSGFCKLIAAGLREDGAYLDEIDDQFVRDIERCAPLHDIGKVGISDSILLKPSKLTPAEWSIMKLHTVIGAETLRPLVEGGPARSYLKVGYDIAWCHHERWDGSGYPRGVAGEDIPLAARILALADCYDALTSRRPYKEPWAHEDALKYCRDHSGTQFDPKVVDAFQRRAIGVDRIRRSLIDTEEEVGEL